MQNPLYGQKAAILVANGFSEQDLIALQRIAQNLGADTRIVSMDQGLVNSWNGEGWGLNFAADQALNTSLAADYSLLIVPGGQRSVEKLKLTAHTKRFINGFLACGKQVIVANEALDLLLFTEALDSQDVTGASNLRESVEAIGLNYRDEAVVVDGNLLTCRFEAADVDAIKQDVASFLADKGVESQAAAA